MPTRRPAPDDLPVTPGLARKFRGRLLRWFAAHGRDLPWRRTGDPYRILVSEIMLQQTQVDRVRPKYEAWVARWPSFESLASARLDDVCAEWRPLGYNVRPVRLHSIACETVARYGGRLPDDPEALLGMKGIGRYTAGAVLSFAFRKDAAILDTNVLRVLHRVFVGPGLPDGHAVSRQPRADYAARRRLWALSERLVPRGGAWAFNSALMDFGAMVCTARKPLCLVCPVADFCRSQEGVRLESGGGLRPPPDNLPVTSIAQPGKARLRSRRASESPIPEPPPDNLPGAQIARLGGAEPRSRRTRGVSDSRGRSRRPVGSKRSPRPRT